MMDDRRKRLLYRANYRGFKEADILLGGFAKANLAMLSEAHVAEFEDLLTNKDHDIYDWITRKIPVPAQYETEVLEMIRAFKPDY